MSASAEFIKEELQNANSMGKRSSVIDSVANGAPSSSHLQATRTNSDSEEYSDIEGEDNEFGDISEEDEESQQSLDQTSESHPDLRKELTFLALSLLYLVIAAYKVSTFTPNADQDFEGYYSGFLAFMSSFIFELTSSIGFFYAAEWENFNKSHQSNDENPLNGKEWLTVDDEYNFDDRFEKIKKILIERYSSNAKVLIAKLEDYCRDRGYISTISQELLSAPISMGNKRYNKEDIYFIIKAVSRDSPIFMDRSYTFKNPMGNRENIIFQFKNLQIDTEFRDIIAEDFEKIDDCLESNKDKSLQDLDRELQRILGKKFSAALCEEKSLENSETSRGSLRLTRS